MKSLIRRILVLTSVIIISLSTYVFAGNADIMFTDPTVKRGQTFDLTVKVKSKNVALQKADINIHYDPQILEFQSGTDAEGESGNVHIVGKGTGTAGSKTLVYTLKFLTKQAGTTKITLQTYQVTDGNDNDVVIDHKGSSTVKVTSLNKNSSNAVIKNIVVGPGNLTPDFVPNQLEYNMDVNNDVESLTQLEITTDDLDAKYEIKGNENFKSGVDNKVSILVTAPNGTSKKTYVIHVNKLETGSDASGGGAVGDRIWSQKFYVTIQDIDDGETPPEGYVLTPKDGENRAFNVWTEEGNDTPDYYIFRGVDADGKADYYRYDINGKTIQRYIPDPTSKNIQVIQEREKQITNTYNSMADRYNILLIACICLAALVVILIIVIIIVSASKNGNNKKRSKGSYDYDDDDDDDYDDDYDDDDDEDDYKGRNVRRTLPDRPSDSRRYRSDDDLEIEDLN